MDSKETVQALMDSVQRGRFDTARTFLSDDFQISGFSPKPLNSKKWLWTDLPNALQNENGGNHRAALHVPADQPPENWNADDDYQLKRAEDFLRQGVVVQRLQARAG